MEDAVGWSDGAFWVLDGVSSIAPSHHSPAVDAESDGLWLVQEYNRALVKACGASKGLREILTDASRDVAKQFEGGRFSPQDHPDECPLAAIAIAKTDSSCIQIATLGDCRAIVEYSDGTCCVLGGCRELEARAERTRTAVRGIVVSDGGRSVGEIRPQIRAVLASNRRGLNQKGGYWLLTVDAVGPSGATVCEFDLARVTRAILVTDGLYRLVDTFRACAPCELLNSAFARGLPELTCNLRDLERRNSRSAEFCEVKIHDDVAAIALSA